MGEEIAFEKSQISDFQELVTLTLTLDRVILHTVMHHSSTSTYIPNFIEIEKTFCGRTDGRTYGRTDIWDILLGQIGGVDLTITESGFSTVRSAYCYRSRSVVCWSVNRSAKTGEAMEMPFASTTLVGPGKHLLHIADRFERILYCVHSTQYSLLV